MGVVQICAVSHLFTTGMSLVVNHHQTLCIKVGKVMTPTSYFKGSTFSWQTNTQNFVAIAIDMSWSYFTEVLPQCVCFGAQLGQKCLLKAKQIKCIMYSYQPRMMSGWGECKPGTSLLLPILADLSFFRFRGLLQQQRHARPQVSA